MCAQFWGQLLLDTYRISGKGEETELQRHVQLFLESHSLQTAPLALWLEANSSVMPSVAAVP